MDDINEAILLSGYIAAGICKDEINFFEPAAQQHIQELIDTNIQYHFDWDAVYSRACQYIDNAIDKKHLPIEKTMAHHRAGKAMATMTSNLFKAYQKSTTNNDN